MREAAPISHGPMRMQEERKFGGQEIDRSTPVSQREYMALAEEIHARAPHLPPIFCGFAACIDRICDLDTVLSALEAHGDKPQSGLRERLVANASAGSGGEFDADWPDGARVFADIQSVRTLPGGSSTQVAQQLAIAGAKPLLALERRDPVLLDLLHPNIQFAPLDETTARRQAQLPVATHQIIEFSPAQQAVQSPRADRIILRFSNDRFEFDEAFAVFSRAAAGGAGAAMLSGFNALERDEFDRALTWSRRLASAWKDAGVPLIHLELADFASPDDRQRLLEAFGGICNSVGMNVAELAELAPVAAVDEASVPAAMLGIAGDLQLDRVNVHADRWAISLTHADPETELKAISYGCYAASARAHAGYAVDPATASLTAALRPSPWPSIRPAAHGGHFVSCPTPHLAQPTTTIGLGDSFLAGTLAFLAGAPGTNPVLN